MASNYSNYSNDNNDDFDPYEYRASERYNDPSTDMIRRLLVKFIKGEHTGRDMNEISIGILEAHLGELDNSQDARNYLDNLINDRHDHADLTEDIKKFFEFALENLPMA